MSEEETERINALCPVADSFQKCKECFYQKSRTKPPRCGGFCRADGESIITGLDKNGQDVQSGDVGVEEL